jgi:hypothetical protein
LIKKIKSKTKSFVKRILIKLRRFMEQDTVGWSKRAFFRGEFNEQTTVAMAHRMFRTLYTGDEKIRIAFIFQGASFWPSWESFWLAVKADDRFEAKMYVCDDTYSEKSQFLTARTFLTDLGISFAPIHDVNLTELNPHIVVIQTPYDGGHRPKSLHGNKLTARGFRVIYVPYGIEISDIQRARNDHFAGAVTCYAWRIYTFSKRIIPEYKMRSQTGGDMVRAFGHPKFDFFVGPDRPDMPADILAAANGRKIVLWKVHFPKKIGGRLITPSMKEYFEFAKVITEYPDLFFVFMPHPKFYETANRFFDADAFMDMLDTAENAVQFFGDDYRGILLNADFYMMDRSALMIEAGVTEKPVLFLQNNRYTERMTPPVQQIVDTYYSAVNCAGMRRYIDDVVIKGEDMMEPERIAAVRDVMPPLTGKSGIMIKNDIIEGLVGENPNIPARLRAHHARLNAKSLE